MWYAPNHPFRTAFRPLGAFADGRMPWGRFSEFSLAANDYGGFTAIWEIERFGGWTTSQVQVMSGSTRIASIFENQPQMIDLTADSRFSRTPFDFVLLPRDMKLGSEPLWTSRQDLRNTVRVSWDITSEAWKVDVYDNLGGGGPVDTSASNYVARFTRPKATASDSNVTLGGVWRHPFTTYATLTFTCTTGGSVGTAAFSWAWGTESGSVTTSANFQSLANGLRIKWASGASYSVSDTFTVSVSMPESATIQDLSMGLWKWKAAAFDKPGNRSLSSSEATATIQGTPTEPMITSVDYVDGSGEATLHLSIPSDYLIDEVRVYRNYPAASIDPVDTSRPWTTASVTPGTADKEVTVSQLKAGTNRLIARCHASNGVEEDNYNEWTINLDGSLNAITYPNPPRWVKATLQSDYTVDVTVSADASSDTIKVYGNGGSGAIDYSASLGSVSNPGTSALLTIEGLSLSDGVHTLAVRATSSSVEETNTFVTCTVSVDSDPATAPSNLSAEVI